MQFEEGFPSASDPAPLRDRRPAGPNETASGVSIPRPLVTFRDEPGRLPGAPAGNSDGRQHGPPHQHVPGPSDVPPWSEGSTVPARCSRGLRPGGKRCPWQPICQWPCQCKLSRDAENDRTDSRYVSVPSVLTAQSVQAVHLLIRWSAVCRPRLLDVRPGCGRARPVCGRRKHSPHLAHSSQHDHRYPSGW
jgi:hypothetical protein